MSQTRRLLADAPLGRICEVVSQGRNAGGVRRPALTRAAEHCAVGGVGRTGVGERGAISLALTFSQNLARANWSTYDPRASGVPPLPHPTPPVTSAFSGGTGAAWSLGVPGQGDQCATWLDCGPLLNLSLSTIFLALGQDAANPAT